MRRGFTVIELLVVSAMLVLLTVALAGSLTMSLRYADRLETARIAETEGFSFEERVRVLLQTAYLSPTPDDPTTFFVGGSALENVGDSSSIVFTGVGARLPANYLDTDLTFEELNEIYGPQGGVRETQIGTTAIGATTLEGAFLREQTPPDGDPTQGGTEKLLDSTIASLRFEFFDGTNWTTEWDTRTITGRFLPFYIRVAYTRTGDDDTERTFLVRLPYSEVAYLDYLAATGGQQ